MVSPWREVAALPFAFGGPVLRGRLRERPEDFRVDEILGFEADGEGEHCLIHIRKAGLNTEEVARQLARHAGVGPRDVSYAGLKDRQAVTSQWFSVHLPGRPDPAWRELDSDRIQVLGAARHRRKLRRGALRGNRFAIRIRDPEGDLSALEATLARMAAEGVPNYFGEQRFGIGYGNLEQADRLFRGELRRPKPHLRGLYLSAARSQIFNEILARRVAEGTWNGALLGDLMQLDGSRAWFPCAEPDAEILRRVAELDIHPTGALWGRGTLESGGAVAELEQTVAGAFPGWCEGLAGFGLEQERRGLRMRLADPALTRDPSGDLVLEFALPAGSFATAVLRELVTASRDPQSPLAMDGD